jgi:Xaa-Pro aminopeptidase
MRNLKKLVGAFSGRYDYLVLTKGPNLAYAVGMPDALGLVVDLRSGYSTLYVSRLDYSRAKATTAVEKVVAVALGGDTAQETWRGARGGAQHTRDLKERSKGEGGL